MKDLFKYCSVSNNSKEDCFVGINIKNNELNIKFPLGYNISIFENDNILARKHIRNLINILKNPLFNKTIEGKSCLISNINIIDLPMQDYINIIFDYFQNGYYMEKEIKYKSSSRGNINWSKTIKQKTPIIYKNKPYYLNFITKEISYSENALITLIHQYCVYESFKYIGWLYTDFIPIKPSIKLNKSLFLNVINNQINNTFNDAKIHILNSMKNIIINSQSNMLDNKDFLFGTYEFEYIWENLLDYVFGISKNEKEKYFPHTIWNLKYGKDKKNSSLRPDSIMKFNNELFILDAKYYRYGCDNNIKHLPQTSSIVKQKIYGEYAESISTDNPIIYNAFLMPFNKLNNAFEITNENYLYIGSATIDWNQNKRSYETISGILVDTTNLMLGYKNNNFREIESKKLKELIDENNKIPSMV